MESKLFKKLFSMLLVVAMVLSMCPTMVFADGEEAAQPEALNLDPDGNGCPHCEGPVTWIDFVEAEHIVDGMFAAPEGTVHYRLTANVSGDVSNYTYTENHTYGSNGASYYVQYKSKFAIAEGTDVVLDLNGFYLRTDKGGTSGYRVLINHGTLSVVDSVGTGEIYGGYLTSSGEGTSSAVNTPANGANIYTTGTFNLYGGTIRSGRTTSTSVYGNTSGGNIYGDAGSVINIYGGTVRDGINYRSTAYTQSSYHSGGGNIASAGEVNIYGGTISGGHVYTANYDHSTASRTQHVHGGNIYIYGGDTRLNKGGVSSSNDGLNIYGGTITGGRVECTRTHSSSKADAYTYGGNISCKSAPLTISGGTISDGAITTTATGKTSSASNAYAYGGNIYATGSTVTITGGTITNSSVTAIATAAEKQAYSCGRGGAIYAESDVNISGGTIDGGEINSTATGTGTTGDGIGRAFANGSAIAMRSKVLTISGDAKINGSTATASATGVSFTDTLAPALSYAYGGGIFIEDGGFVASGNAQVTGGTAVTNVAVGEGSTSTKKSEGSNNGGAIWIGGDAKAATTISDNVIITGGSSDNGGSIHINQPITISGNVQIKGGHAVTYGGNLYLAAGADTTIKDNVKITGGTCDYNGGNIYMTGGSTQVYLKDDAEVSGGIAEAGGGNVFVNSNSDFYMVGGTMKDGTAKWATKGTYWGGGNLQVFNGASVTVTGGTISGGTGVMYANSLVIRSDAYIYFYGGTVLGTDANNELPLYAPLQLNSGAQYGLQLWNGKFAFDPTPYIQTCACAEKTGENEWTVWHTGIQPDGTACTADNCKYTATTLDKEEPCQGQHTLVKTEEAPAGCTTTGTKAYWQCSACEDYFADEAAATYIADLEAWKAADGLINALDHDWKPATCTEPKTCDRCDLTEGEPNGHSVVLVPADPSSCTKDGHLAYYDCANCDAYFVDAEATQPIEDLAAWLAGEGYDAIDEHTFTAEIVKDEALKSEADCVNAAVYFKSCADCGAVSTNDGDVFSSGDALGHNYGAWEQHNAAQHKHICGRCGHEEFEDHNNGEDRICDVCNYESACIHQWDEGVVTPPTCHDGGFTTYTCGLCQETKIDNYTDATGHTLNAVKAVDASCLTSGHAAYWDCANCDCYFADAEGLAQIENIETWLAEGGEGYIAALGHDPIAHDAKAPTCTEPGWDAYETCSRCDYSTKVEKPALGHTTEKTDAKAPDCVTPGAKAYWYCSVCEKYFSDEAYENEIVDLAAWLAENGEGYVAALGHATVPHEAKAPTCVEFGWDAYETCSRCDYSTYVEKPATGIHDYKLTDDNTKFVCSVCQDEKAASWCEACESYEIWNAWDGKTKFPESGHYYLAESATMNGSISIAKGVEICLDLRGNNLSTATGKRAFYLNGTMNLMDSTAKFVEDQYVSGAIIGNKVADDGAVFDVADNGNLTLLSGTIRDGQTTAYNYYGGNIYAHGTGKLYVKGGLIANGKAGRGGNIYGSGEVHISGGIIEDGRALKYDGRSTSARGGNIASTDYLYVTGGIIRNGGAQTAEGNTLASNAYGGNIMSTGGVIYISGGTIEGGGTNTDGFATAMGGNIALMYARTYITGGTIKNGKASTGGNIYTTTASGTYSAYLAITGGTFIGGHATSSGDHIYVTKSTDNHMKDEHSIALIFGGTFEAGATSKADIYVETGRENTYVAIYGGQFAAKPAYGAACAQYCYEDGYYTYWHAEGACETCGHTYGDEPCTHSYSHVVTSSDGASTKTITWACNNSVVALTHGNTTPVEHDWADATCTAPSTCNKCGQTTGTANGHADPLTEVSQVDATCTASGLKAYAYCSVCNAYYVDENGVEIADFAAWQTGDGYIAKLDHTYDQKNTDTLYKATDATCTAAATYFFSCSCGEKGSETFSYGEVDKDAHTDLHQEGAKAPTCTEDGWFAYEYCGDCEYTTYQVDPKTGHTYIYTSNDDKKTHTIGCEKGDYSEVADCADENGDKFCDLCEQKLIDPKFTVDGVEVETLEEALAAARDGSVIKLLDNLVLTERLTLDKELTIRMNGYSITGAFEDAYGMIYVKKGAVVTFMNGLIENTADIAIGNYGAVIVGTDATVKGYGAGLYNFYFAADYYGVARVNGKVNEIWNCGELVISEYGVVEYLDNSGYVTVYGTVNELYARDGSDAPDVYNGGLLIISDVAKVTTLSIPEDYKLVEVEPYIYKVVAKVYTVEANGEKYETLAEALAVGGEVKLLANIVLTERTTVSVDAVLDLNGYSITGDFTDAFGLFYVKKGATLTVKNGLIENTADVAIGNYGKVIIEASATVNGEGAGLYNFYYAADYYGEAVVNGKVNSIWNSGKLTINASAQVAYLDNSGYTEATGYIAELYLGSGEDAPAVPNAGLVKGDIAGKFELAGGTFETSKYVMIGATEGKYISTDAIFTVAPNATMDMTIVSGTITLNETLWYTMEGQTLTIAEAATFVIPEGKTLYVNGSNVVVNGTAANFGTLILANGAHLVGDVAGTFQMAGGTFETSKYVMIGATEGKYLSTDAIFTVAPNATMDMTFISGTVTLNETLWYTLAGQTLAVNEGAKFVIPAGKTLYINESVVVVNGEIEVEGTVLLTANATVAYADGTLTQKFVTNAGDTVIYENGVYKAHSHDYDAVVTDPTCTDKGYTTYTCKNAACGHSYIGNEVAETGHSHENIGYTDPTIEADGFWTYKCHCGDSYTVIDENTRLHVNVPTVDAEDIKDNIETEDTEATTEEIQDVIDHVVHGNEAVVDKDIFVDDANNAVIEQMKNENPALADKEPVLHITLQGMGVKTEAGVLVAHKLVFDVTPMLGTEKIENLVAPLTFHLPVDDSLSGNAYVFHEGEFMGVYEIVSEGGHNYVVVSSQNFSEFTVEVQNANDVAVNMTTGDTYTDLQAALSAAAKGDTVKLLKDTAAEGLYVGAGKTVDLNGHKLTVTDYISASYTTTHIVDSSKGQGLLVVTGADVALNNKNSQLPVWTAEGIRFVEVKIDRALDFKDATGAANENVAYYRFAFSAQQTLLDQILANGSDGTSLAIRVRVDYTTTNGMKAYQYFEFTSEMVQKYYNHATGWQNAAFRLYLTGVAGVADLAFTTEVVSTAPNGTTVIVGSASIS